MWQFPCFSLIIRYLFLGFTCTKEGGKAEDRDVGESTPPSHKLTKWEQSSSLPPPAAWVSIGVVRAVAATAVQLKVPLLRLQARSLSEFTSHSTRKVTGNIKIQT